MCTVDFATNINVRMIHYWTVKNTCKRQNISTATHVTEIVPLRFIDIGKVCLDGMGCTMSQQPPWQPQQSPNNQPQWGQQSSQYQQSFYNQPTQATPGQFQQPSYNNFPPPRKPGLWTWYKSQTRKVKLSIGCGTILALLLFFSCIGTAVGRANLAPHSNQAATVQTVTSTSAQTPTTNPPAPGGYLASGSNYVLFIQFTNTNGTLSGEWNEADVVTNTSKNMLQVNPFHTSFSAFLNGTQFNLDVNGRTYAGSFDGNNITIEFPQQDGTLAPITLAPASIDNYNNAITNLQNTVNQENQNTADAQATTTATTNEQQATSDANAQLGNALNQLGADTNTLSSISFSDTLNAYASSWQQMQKDYAQEQADAKNGCGDGNYNYGTVQYDAGTVDYDYGNIQYDDGSLNYDKNTYNSELSTVQSDIQAVNNAWSQLQQAVANNSTGSPAPAYSSDDIHKALSNAQNAENTAQNTWKSAANTAAQYDNEASALKQQADAIPGNMHCT
jgi:hypothetical protein